MTGLAIVVAPSLSQARILRELGHDPVVVQANEHEVYVMANQCNTGIIDRIVQGCNWSTAQPDGTGRTIYIYTRLKLGQVVEHLVDPTKHQGSG